MIVRYGSADEMHEAVYSCLVKQDISYYSVYLSYRVASDALLAKLLFDELNHRLSGPCIPALLTLSSLGFLFFPEFLIAVSRTMATA